MKGESNSKGQSKKQDKEIRFDDMGDLDELMGLNVKEPILSFECIACGRVDPVPAFVLDEFSWGLKKGQEVELSCPKCNGTMRRQKEEKAEG
jgi:hypothetical protein